MHLALPALAMPIMDNQEPFTVDEDADAQLGVRSIPHVPQPVPQPVPAGRHRSMIQQHVHEQTPLFAQSHEGLNRDSRISSGRASSFSRKWRKPNIIWLFPFLLLFMLSFGGLIVPRINLTVSLVCREYLANKAAHDPTFTYFPVVFGSDNSQCQIPEVQSRVARLQLYLNLTGGILSALVSPRLGHLSDIYGRTRILAVNALGIMLSELVVVIVAANSAYMPSNALFLYALLDGLAGAFTSTMALTASYASDCTSPEKRSVAFGFLHGCFFIGTSGGPLLVALLLKLKGDIMFVFYCMLALNVLFFLAVLLVLPESLSKERQRAARVLCWENLSQKEDSWLSFKRWNPKNIFTPLSILFPVVGHPSKLFPNRRGASPALRRNIILLASIDTVGFGTAMAMSQILIIYAGYMFGWGNVESSIFIFIISAVRVVNLFVALPIVTWIFPEKQRQGDAILGSSMLEITLIRASLMIDMLGYGGFALAKSGSVLTLSGIVASLGGMGMPMLQSSITKHVPRDRIGQILGAKGLLHAMSRVIAPTVCNFIYSLTVGKYTQMVFVCLAAVFGVAFCSSLCLRPNVYLEVDCLENSHEEANEDGEEVNDSLLRP